MLQSKNGPAECMLQRSGHVHFIPYHGLGSRGLVLCSCRRFAVCKSIRISKFTLMAFPTFNPMHKLIHPCYARVINVCCIECEFVHTCSTAHRKHLIILYTAFNISKWIWKSTQTRYPIQTREKKNALSPSLSHTPA